MLCYRLHLLKAQPSSRAFSPALHSILLPPEWFFVQHTKRHTAGLRYLTAAHAASPAVGPAPAQPPLKGASSPTKEPGF